MRTGNLNINWKTGDILSHFKMSTKLNKSDYMYDCMNTCTHSLILHVGPPRLAPHPQH